jgi:AsmA protein
VEASARRCDIKRVLKILAAVVSILIVSVIALPFVIDASSSRPRLESELTDALGRQVKVGNLALSLLSGGVKADDISIADDPAFGEAPFVQAKSLKAGVELIPLIFSKSVHVTDLTLNGLQINLVRSENGEKWNFSELIKKKSIQPAAQLPKATPAKPAGTKSAEPASSEPLSRSNPNLSVARVSVNDGRLDVRRARSGGQPSVYYNVNI